jgi:hypothetical protein
MQKKKYITTAEKKGYSFVLANLVSDHVKTTWSAESADPWWLAVKGAQWDRVRSVYLYVMVYSLYRINSYSEI